MIGFIKTKVERHFTFWDIGLLKTYGAIPGLMIGAYFPQIIINVQLLLGVIFGALLFRYVYLIFIKNDFKEKA